MLKSQHWEQRDVLLSFIIGGIMAIGALFGSAGMRVASALKAG